MRSVMNPAINPASLSFADLLEEDFPSVLQETKTPQHETKTQHEISSISDDASAAAGAAGAADASAAIDASGDDDDDASDDDESYDDEDSKAFDDIPGYIHIFRQRVRNQNEGYYCELVNGIAGGFNVMRRWHSHFEITHNTIFDT